MKVVSETSVNSFDLARAIRSGVDVPEQTEILYRSEIKGWELDSIHSWTVTHRQSLNSLDLILEKNGELLWSHQWEKTFNEPKAPGKVGLFADSQNVKFFDLTIQNLCII